MCIFDSNKHLICGFYYSKLKKQHGENSDLHCTDTDSLLLEVKTKYVYKDMEQTITEYDTSDYPKYHYLHSMVNMEVYGKIEEECAGRPIRDNASLHPTRLGCMPSCFSTYSGSSGHLLKVDINRDTSMLFWSNAISK